MLFFADSPPKISKRKKPNFAISKEFLMKKTLFLILFLSSITLFAQTHHAYFELKSGMSLPVLDYSSNNLETGCFTEPGITFSLEAGMKIYKQWGVSIQSGFQLHSVDVGLLGWEKMQADPFLEDLYIRSDPYRIIHIVAGPDYSFPFHNKFNLDLKLLGGVFFSRTPYQLYKPTYFMVGPPYYEITSSSDISFAYGGGARFRYAITSCYEVSMQGEFLSSQVAFPFQSASTSRIENKTISFVNISAGLVLYLF
jgi:hypothetical protein